MHGHTEQRARRFEQHGAQRSEISLDLADGRVIDALARGRFGTRQFLEGEMFAEVHAILFSQ